MGEMEGPKTITHNRRNDSKELPTRINLGLAMPSFLTQLHGKVQNSLKSHLRRLGNDNGTHSSSSGSNKNNLLPNNSEVNLEEQMQAWRANPTWTEQTSLIKVTVPKGSLCNLKVKVNVGLPPDAVYNIVTDPDNKRVFKNIKEVISRKVLVDEGSRQVVELEQAAMWRFLWWSGIISVHVLVDQNRDTHTMKFRQVKTGFMKQFEGCWVVEPLLVDQKLCHPFVPKTLSEYATCTKGKGRIGSKVSLEQLIQPAIVPPPPISWYLRGITAKTTEMLINDLAAEAAKIRGDFNSENSKGDFGISDSGNDECEMEHILDIKQRWALRRRNAKGLNKGSSFPGNSPTYP